MQRTHRAGLYIEPEERALQIYGRRDHRLKDRRERNSVESTSKSGWRPSNRVLTLLALVSLLLAATWIWLSHSVRRHAEMPGPPDLADQAGGKAPSYLPDIRFDLVDHHNRSVSEQDFRDRYLLVTFGYTYCPDICPTTLQNMAEVMALLKSRQGGADLAATLQPMFVTVDPGRDSVEVLAEYVDAFDADILGLTGEPDQIVQAARNFRVYVGLPDEEERRQGDYLVDHSAYIYFVAPGGRMINYFPHETAAEDIVGKLLPVLSAPPRSGGTQ
jgi:protein SCO1/2